jgi:hypothetical protein
MQPLINNAVAGTKLQPRMVSAIGAGESGNTNNIPQDNKAAVGPMQILPSTAAAPGFGVQSISPADLTDPAKNYAFGAQYFDGIGKKLYGDNWNPEDPQQFLAALRRYRGATDVPYEQKVFAHAGLQYPGGGPTTVATNVDTPGAPSAAEQAGNEYGLQMFNEYRTRAANAARSPYAAVRALAPELMQTAMSAMQYNRWIMQPTGDGQWMVADRFGIQKPDIQGRISPELMIRADQDYVNQWSGAMRNGTAPPEVQQGFGEHFARAYPPAWAEDPATKQRRPYPNPAIPADAYIPPGYAGGAGPATPGGPPSPAVAVGPSPETARKLGVPVSPINPVAGLNPADAAQAAVTERAKANEVIQPDVGQVNQAQNYIDITDQYTALAKKLQDQGYLGPGISASLKRRAAMLEGSPAASDLQQLESLGHQLITAARIGSGIQRVTNMDMQIFQNAGLGPEKDLDATMSIADGMKRKFQRAINAAEFERDYVDANGTVAGMQNAWDQYQTANPIYKLGPAGAPVVNDKAIDRRDWFRDMADLGNPAEHRPGTGTEFAKDPVSGRQYRSNGVQWMPAN